MSINFQSTARHAAITALQLLVFCTAHVCLASLSIVSWRLSLTFHLLHTCINKCEKSVKVYKTLAEGCTQPVLPLPSPLQLASLAYRVWCAIKAQKKIFWARWASTSYLEKHESRPVVTGSEVCTSQMSTKDCLGTAFPCVCGLNCTFKLYSDTVCHKYTASDHLCTTHIHSSTV